MGDPKNIGGGEQTGTFCRNYSCKEVRTSKETKNLWLAVVNHDEKTIIIERQRNGQLLRLTPLNTDKKHGDMTTYQRFLDEEGDIYALDPDGEIQPTGVNIFLSNDLF